MEFSDVDILGRKIFFIAPDKSIITNDFLESLCESGYEAYSIQNDSTCLLKDKIDLVIKNFPNCILYFNIDAKISDIDWKDYIRNLQNNYANSVLIGVLYSESNDNNGNELANYYVRDVGIHAGCIPLHQNKISNIIETILKVLKQTGAKGRRDKIRADCDTNCSVSLSYNGSKVPTTIEDVSLTHFRCVSTENIGMKIFDKVRDVRLNINGLLFTSDAVLIMHRTKGQYVTYIFMFIHDRPKDAPELDEETRKLLNKNVYELISRQKNDFLNREFKKLKKF